MVRGPVAGVTRLLKTAAVTCLLTVGVAVGLPPFLSGAWSSAARAPLFLGLAWAGFALGALVVLRLPTRTAVVLILAGGLLLPAAAALSPPRSSDDVYRYGWDARVQLAGVDPYRYPPAATELAGLRDPTLWPAHSNWCVGPSSSLTPGCTLINRPAVHTIYPPVAQGAFVAARAFGPGPYRPYQWFAVALALAVTVALLHGLRRLGHDPRRAVLWAWCPAVALEAGNNAHIDVLAALLTVAGLIVLASSSARRGALAGGALLGLAIATKLTPVLVAPAVARRRPVAVLGALAGAVAVVYGPHVLAVGAAVLGYVPGYLREEGYADGERFALLTAVLPAWAASLVAVAALAVVGLIVLRTADPDRPWRGATVMVGTALLIAAPTYPWYALLLVALVALGGGAWWLAVAAAGYVAQYGQYLRLETAAAQRIGYGLAALIVLACSVGRSVPVGALPGSRVPAVKIATGSTVPTGDGSGAVPEDDA